MASSSSVDVIELGSSDEDTEPIPKKKKVMSKPMVHIPNELPGITIKPARLKGNPVSSIGEGVTVTKVPSRGIQVANPFANKNKLNGKPIIPSKSVIQPSRLNLVPKPEVKISPFVKKIGSTIKGFGQRQIPKGVPTTMNVPFQSRLPPGITVKRANQTIIKHDAKKFPAKNIQVQRQKHLKSSKVPEMVCVDLDDDDPPPSSAGPQWYLRPQDPKDNHDSKGNTTNLGDTDETQTSSKEENIVTRSLNIEKQNNKELEPSKFIEITIEDSPSKPQKSKRRRDMDELAITIEDSPIKSATDKPAPVNSSDDEKTTKDTDKHSKKKLEYSRTEETMNEIEIEITPVEEKSATQHVETTTPNDNADTDIVEIEESPVKPLESETTTTPKKKKPNPQPLLKLNVIKTAPVKSQPKVGESKIITSPSEPGEFNPTYQSFINLCFRLDNSDDMNTIVEKKIKTFYRQVPKEYTESEAFIDLVGSKMCSMKAVPDKMYMYIKDVVDELNMQRKIAKAQPAILDVVNKDREKILYGDESEFDLKRQRQIRKLEKTLKKLHRAIQKLEEQEVDFDDEEDSVYLLTERYKERLIRVHAKFCQLTNTKMPSEPQVRIDARPGQPKGAAKRLEKWINKKVPIGTPLPFPDFHDVLRCVRDANQEDKLGWNEADVMEEARDLFTRCGKKLQRRRQENEWRLAASRIQAELDPAEESEELKKKLDQNRRVAFVKESEVLNKFADRQNQLNLEAVEIGDKEANESPVETDEEEPSEEKTSLETKEKRKQRLKRLLQEKSQKPTDEKKQSQEIKEDSEQKPEPEEKEESSKDIKNKGEIKSKERDPLTAEDKSDTEKIHSLSDDSSKIDSDMDELHLLQKLHSDVVDSSTLESSDSETQIDIISSGDSKMRDSDVISIENSSYSESENNHEPEIELVSYSKNRVISEIVDTEVEIECSVAGVQKKINRSYNDECNKSVENILLASSDDEDDKDKEATHDPISVSEINVNQSSEMNADSTDASTMDSTEVTVAKNNNLNEIDIIGLSSTENSDRNIPITDETISVINSVESVQLIDVEPTNNGSNKIGSSESNHEESNSVKDELDKIKAICKKDSADNSNDISGIVKSSDDFAEAKESSVKSAGEAAIGSKDKDPSDDVRNARSSVENKTSHKEGENERPIIDEKESSSYKDENETSDKPDDNVKTSTNEREHENSVSKDKMELSSNNDEKEMSDKTDDIVKMSSIECENENSMSKDKMELSSNNDEKEMSDKTDDIVKMSSNECENKKSTSKDDMELSSNNDENETSDKTDDNVNEFTNQRYVVDDSDACSNGVTSVEPMEVDINMDNT